MEAPPVLDALIAEAARRFGRDPASLPPDADLYDALGIDSIAALDLLDVLEVHFDVELPDHELRGVHSFRQLAQLVERRR